jgi:hypothetical protein
VTDNRESDCPGAFCVVWSGLEHHPPLPFSSRPVTHKPEPPTRQRAGCQHSPLCQTLVMCPLDFSSVSSYSLAGASTRPASCGLKISPQLDHPLVVAGLKPLGKGKRGSTPYDWICWPRLGALAELSFSLPTVHRRSVFHPSRAPKTVLLRRIGRTSPGFRFKGGKPSHWRAGKPRSKLSVLGFPYARAHAHPSLPSSCIAASQPVVQSSRLPPSPQKGFAVSPVTGHGGNVCATLSANWMLRSKPCLAPRRPRF